MKYGLEKAIVLQLLRGADIANTINGGVSQAKLAFEKTDEFLLATVSVPGVATSDLKVEIIDKKVIVEHFIPFEYDGVVRQVPQVIAVIPITAEMDFHNIEARKSPDNVCVYMPFNELARKDFRKDLD